MKKSFEKLVSQDLSVLADFLSDFCYLSLEMILFYFYLFYSIPQLDTVYDSLFFNSNNLKSHL